MTVSFITDKDGIDHAIIENADGEFTSMPKSVYEEQLANEAQAL
jgi:hypothetical protein